MVEASAAQDGIALVSGAGVPSDGGRARLLSSAGRRMLVLPATIAGFAGETAELDGRTVRFVPTTAAAAARLRELVPGLRPQPLGNTSSFGFGDRLGLATPGHVQALRFTRCTLAPIFAQQSARELERTGRSYEEVLDAATWGVVETGWSSGYGADADHLRTVEEVNSAAVAGFTMLTLDPSEHVDRAATRAERGDLERRVQALPWQVLEDDWGSMRGRYTASAAAAGGDLEIARAAAMFGHAVAHVATLTRAVDAASVEQRDIEVSVDETPEPTTPFQHAFIAVELRRLGVRLTSLAPRFPGRWEKAVDEEGNLAEIASAIKAHAEVAAEHGPYKLSVHSGSDKLSVYPLLAEAGATLHVKTSGTSYLEALRVVAGAEPELFRAILTVAREHFASDRRTYALAPRAGVPTDTILPDPDLPSLLDDPGARQGLHVTYGSVLGDARLAPALLAAVQIAAEAYAATLERHFARHLEPLRGVA